VEKPSSEEVHTSLANAGIYVLEREVLHMIPKGQEVSIERDVSPELQAVGKLRAYTRVPTGGTSGRLAATLRPPTTSSPARLDAAQSFGT
jgi:hypothetical protein